MPRYRALKFAALLTLATVLAAPRQTEVQSPADRAVRAVVDSFFDAVAREKWESAAALVDRRRFEVYFKQAIRNARMMLPQPPMTVEAVMARDSTMPRVVAEWEVAQMARYKRTANDNFAADPGYLIGGERVMILHRSAGRWRIEPRRDLLRPGNMGIN